MVSKRIKYARAHLSRRKYIALLARPNLRRLQKDFNIVEQPFTVPRSALKFRPTKRIKIMAQPKVVTKKYDPAKEASHYPRIPQRVLSAKISKRIQDLSLPQKSQMHHIRKIFMGNKTRMTRINKLLTRIRKSRYQKYRLICNTLNQQAAAREANWRKKLKRALSKPGDWERHQKVLERIAKPKPKPTPPPPMFQKLGTKRKYDPTRVDQLAQPVIKQFPEMNDPFKVRPSALKYKITDQIKELALRKFPRKYIKSRIPGKVSKAALKFTPTERINILATPSARKPGRETDLKENAFDVSPAALKAWCSPRIKVLANPKSYGRLK